MLASKDGRRQKFGRNSKQKDCRMLPAIPTLKKDTIEATYEHINRLVKEESGENFDNVKEFIEYNDKLNVFEKKVQVIIVDSLKIKEGVINCLLSDDVHLIKRVLRCDWFFKDAVSPEFYETSVFPNVSFSTRCKIINKLSRNVKQEEDAERLFHFTKQNYGSKYAEMFLPRCSSQFISAYITECKPLFHNNTSVKILMNICKRFPEIAVSFLEVVFQKDYPHTNARRKYTKLIVYIARNHPVLFMSFFEKCYAELWFFHFGKKLTKTFAKQLGNLIKNSSGQLLKGVINKSEFFKCINFDDQVDFITSVVRGKRDKQATTANWFQALPCIIPLIKMIAPNERVRLLETAFSKIFNQTLKDHPEIWTPRFLEVLPVDYREYYVNRIRNMKENEIMNLQLHKNCEDPERDVCDIFIYLLNCKSAFPKLSALMSKMSTSNRREILLKEMIRNCVINDDSEALESVVNFILIRHKNDDPRMLVRLIKHLQSLNSKILTLNVWVLIEEMVTLVLLKGKEYYAYKSVIEKFIRFKLKHKMDVQCQVRNTMRMNFIPCPYISSLLECVVKPFSRDIIMLFYDEIVNIFDDDATEESVKEKLLTSLLRTINEYNSNVKRHRIEMKNLPRLIEEVDRLMKKSQSNSATSLLDQLMKDSFLRKKYATNLLQVSLIPKTLEHLLKLNPEYVVNSLDNILNDLFSIYSQFTFQKFITSRTRLDFLNITSKIRDLTSEKFKTSVSCKRKVNALKMYSYFATIEDFTELVSDYVPGKERMDFNGKNAEYVEIQMTVPKVIKNVKPDSKNLPLISKYVNKDFLRWVLPSFYSACLNTPSGVILPILKEYFPSKSISVKKIILYRITDISVNDEKLKYFWELWNTEDHSSVRSVILQTISKCFYENPSREIFEMVKKCISEGNELTIQDRPNLSKIPAQYLNEYVVCLWNFTEKYENSRFTGDLRDNLIQHFAPMNIWTLSEEFCNMIIKRYLFDNSTRIQVNNFCCYYLISNPYSLNQKLLFVLQLLRERRENYSSVSSFLAVLRRLAVEDPKRFVGVFEGILEEWPKIYSNVKMFDEYLNLHYAKGYNTIAKKLNFQLDPATTAAEFGKELRLIVNQVPNYSCFVQIIKNTVEDFLQLLNDFDCIVMITNFLGHTFGRSEALIAVGLLPQSAKDTYMEKAAGDSSNLSELSEDFHFVLNKLKDMNDEVVKIYMNLFLGNKIA